MELHACVVARLKTGLFCLLVIVKILIEVGHLLIGKFAGGHAVLEHDTSCCFEIKALIIEITGEWLHNAKLHVVLRTGTA